MSVIFTPASGSTINFGSVQIGASANQSASVAFNSPINSDPGQFHYEGNTTGITGPQASMFTGNMDDSFFGPGADGDSHIFTFSPTILGVCTATLTWVGSGNSGGTGTHTYTLTGTGTPSTSGGGGTSGEATGLVQAFRRELISVKSVTAGIVLAYFNETNFNDILDGRTYIFKAQDLLADRVPTVRRVVVTYIDLGVATVKATVTSVNDLGAIVTQSAVVVLGTVGATGRLMTAFFDLAVTGFRPQLTISQVANGGPFQLSTAMLTGQIEMEVTL